MIKNAKSVVRPYANAVFAQAVADNNMLEWQSALQVLSAASTHEMIKRLLNNTSVTLQEKQSAILSLLQNAPKGIAEIITLLLHNKRLFLATSLLELFEEKLLEHQGVMKFSLTSAHALDDAVEAQIEASLAGKFNKKIVIHKSIDPSLLGGFIVRSDTQVIDASVKGQIQKLAQSLIG